MANYTLGRNTIKLENIEDIKKEHNKEYNEKKSKILKNFKFISKMPNSNKTYYQYWTDYYKPRNVPPVVVENIISSTKPVSENLPETLFYSCDGINIVTNLDGKVITVMNSHPKGSISFKD